jgi:type III secretion system YopN/LcrE/InvE/MxiC family regulator
MSISITDPTNNPQQLSNIKQTASEESVGKRGSEHVKVSMRPAPIANAAAKAAENLEEITQLRSMLTRTDDRKLSKGETEIERLLKQIKRIKKVEKIFNLHQFKGNFAGQEDFTKNNILEKARDFSDDILHQIIAIEDLAEDARAAGLNTDELYEAIEHLYKQNTQEVQAGLNITEEAASQSSANSFSDTTTLRREYTDNILDHKNLKSTYKYLNNKYSKDDIPQAIDIQLKLLAVDLQSLTPSSQTVNLQLIINDLAKLKVISSCYGNCDELVERFARTYNETPFDSNTFLEKMVSLIEEDNWITEQSFLKFASDLQVTDLQQQIFIITQLTNFIRETPENHFNDPKDKDSILKSAADTLDYLIDKEENPHQKDNEIIEEEQNFGVIGEILFDDAQFIEKLTERNTNKK